jgi:aminopeptidase N
VATGLTAAQAARRTALLDVQSYQVLIDLTAEPDRAYCATAITFECREPGASCFADLTADRVGWASLNGTRLDTATVLSEGRLALPELAASNVLLVDAEVAYSRSGQGMSRFTDPADGATYLLANCFPTSAPAVFCCFDQPDLRAEITLTVRAPAGWECVSNGAVIARPPAGRAGDWRFAAMPAVKPYELTLCAGPYVTLPASGNPGRVRIAVRCRPALAGSPGLARIGDIVTRTLAFYQKFLDLPCPYDRLEVIFAPDLGPLAMQLPAVTYVSETMLSRLADASDDHPVMVLAHELAHLWFGCLVEGRWWDDLWLAEAMASYLSYLACTEALGVPAAWAQFAMQGQAAAYRADILPGSQPVASPVNTAADALTRPPAITYSKGTSVIRQLAALLGTGVLRTGLNTYLTTYGWSSATLEDLIGCWSAASGQDLTSWAQQWLREPGVGILRPELTLRPDGAVQSLVVVQEASRPDGGRAPMRTHRLGIGVYGTEDGRLQRRELIDAVVSGGRTEIPGLAGTAAPQAVILNDGDLTFGRIRFDDQSWQALAGAAFDLGDPLAEALCWTAAWDMITAAELRAAEFAGLVVRRISAGGAIPALTELVGFALTAANYYAPPAQRAALLEQLASAALDGTRQAKTDGPTRRALHLGFAACAQSQAQLGVLRSWLGADRAQGPAGQAGGAPGEPQRDASARGDLEVRQALATLAAHGRVTDEELDAFAAGDPVGGDLLRATCRALRPDPAAKQEAWTAALAEGQSPRVAMAHAQGIWTPGQDDVVAPFRDRFFAETLPALGRLERRTAQRLARLLYPATMADARTLAATQEALGSAGLPDSLRQVLIEQQAILRQVIAARAR